jgi:GNAT superfamily N-acetyltransferase
MSLLIRPATDSDREICAKLLAAQLVEHHLEADPTGIAHGITLALAPHSPAMLLLAFQDHAPVAIFLANQIVSVEKSGLVLWVEELYVIPHARRAGVARAILNHVADEAGRRDIRALELEVVPTQAAAFALYRSLGFTDVDRQRMSWKL